MKENKPLVSVIIACYNAEDYMDLCLNSLMEQTYHNLEILICDDASKDGSFQKLLQWQEKDSRIHILKNETNMFSAAARNKCIEASHGEYLMIQDIDDLSRPDRVETLLKELQEHPEIDFVSSSMSAFRQNPDQIFKILAHKKRYPTKWDFLWNQPFFHPTTMLRRECVLAVGGYRVAKETRRGQDYDMFMRLYGKGYHGENYPEPLYIFRLDDANIKRRDFDGRMGEYKIRKLGFKAMGVMPWGFPFLFKPFAAHLVQKVRYMGK